MKLKTNMLKRKEFITAFKESVDKDNFVRLTLSRNVDKTSSLRKAIIKIVVIKKKLHFCIVHRHATNDITKNFGITDGFNIIDDLMENTFLNAALFNTEKDLFYELNNRKERLYENKATFTEIPPRTHDKQKPKLIVNTSYLVQLGILDDKGRVQKDKGAKYKQIKKFVEVIESLLKKNPSLGKDQTINIFDMGSGKGYLTFALYDYLTNNAQIDVKMCGVEARPELVQFCNEVAKKDNFKNLSFQEGFISNFTLPNIDMLIALHACDTATDDAIYKGIEAGAQLIICAPCCHKQIRKQLNATAPLDSITNFGILKERQAEMVTDTIRALLLEANGYKASVFEFISTEHTGKNVMIVGQKSPVSSAEKNDYLVRIKALKISFGIKTHYLETLLK